MSVLSYVKDGKALWKVYINIRSKEDPTIREQKLVLGFESEKAALAEERKLVREITEKLFKRTAQGLTWEQVIDRWELAMRSENAHFKYQPTTITDHVSRLKIWTTAWLNRPASELNKGDAREAIANMAAHGRSKGYQHQLKHTVNVVYDWGIEQRLIRNVHTSPMRGLQLGGLKGEKVPDILTLEEVRKLLLEAKRLEHPWYPIWATALLTGMRNGELHALLWSDVDLESRRITVSKSFHTRGKFVKCTKSGQWRTVPISDELYALFLALKATAGKQPHVLPRFWKWDGGLQAGVLRAFCKGVGLPSIRFHALRACFATQLLAHDVAPARVMKICGWQELKTMQHYTRLAGVDERGATQVLKMLPSDAAVMGEVVSLFDFKAKSPSA